MSDPVARLTPSPIRRVIAIAMLWSLGGLLVYLGFVAPPASLGWQLVLAGTGVAALYLGERVRRATAAGIELSARGDLRETTGREICRLEDVVGIERGAFAFKPANGFLVRLSRRQPRVWAPGLWWRTGRSVGVGGVTPAAEAKYMAEMLSALIAERDATD